MLKIRSEQFKVFAPVAEDVFVRDVVDYLKSEHGERQVRLPDGVMAINAVPINTLRNMVKGGIAEGRTYDLTSKSALSSYVILMFLTAPNLDQHPLIQHILTDDKIQPDQRLEELWSRTVDQNWVAVKQNYDPSYWRLVSEESVNEL